MGIAGSAQEKAELPFLQRGELGGVFQSGKGLQGSMEKKKAIPQCLGWVWPGLWCKVSKSTPTRSFPPICPPVNWKSPAGLRGTRSALRGSLGSKREAQHFLGLQFPHPPFSWWLFVSQTIVEADSLRDFNLENKITKERKKPWFY